MASAGGLPNPFELISPGNGSAMRALARLAIRPIEHALGLRALYRIYQKVHRDTSGAGFLERALMAVGARYEITPEHRERIPTTGPLLVIANHPYGGIEGIVLYCLLRSVRPDVRVIANYLLGRMPEAHDCMFFVDPFDRPESPRRNATSIRQALSWLQSGGVLIVFPAGEVAHFDVRARAVRDPQWHPSVAKLVRKARVPVLPAYFEGHNGPVFQLAGLVHPRLRTLLLPWAMARASGRTFRVRVGTVVPFTKLESFPSDADMLTYLRMRSYMLATDDLPTHAARRAGRTIAAQPQKIADAASADDLAAELAELPPDSLLIDNNDLQVYVARAHEIPRTMREIGRLRELTFRQAGEGTGQAVDLDRFDRYYRHLFVWNRAAREIVGAYRLGATDEILTEHGESGLYTTTLFHFERGLLDRLNPALELGRSFVRLEYQRQHASLLLLWRGIGRFIAEHPRYNTLFGAVSISNEYRTMSQQMMVAFLESHFRASDLAQYIRPRNPPRWRPQQDVETVGRLVCDMKEMSSLVSEIEADEKGIPILVRQYLQLNAKLLSWNVDPAFSDVIDALMVADLLESDRRMLARYMGREGAETFLAHHEGAARPVGA